MNKKIIGCIALISIFLISKGFSGLQTVAYFSDQLVYTTTIESGEWETKCSITLELVNQTDKKLVDIDIVAGQDSHPKNNYNIYPIGIENDSLTNEESKSYSFDLEHREAFHCNLQWIYFDINAIDEDGNRYSITQVRGKVHNPPGKVKDGVSTAYLKVVISEELVVDDNKKPKKKKTNEREVSNKDVKEMVDETKNKEESETKAESEDKEDESKITENKEKNDEVVTEEKNEEEKELEVSEEIEEETSEEESEVQSQTEESNNGEEVVDNETDNESEEN
ncbi:hypothetical protein [Sutcliffiella horikoshii]|uniref:hypothetical protein n=1 Tax=Sutcliffiella horikoshii TaxID=79883 RepID=UPI001CFE9977|nr:hypothetical protein [Sutcliffiella horikoshii]